MAGYLGSSAVFLSTTAVDIDGNNTVGGDIIVGGTVDGRDVAVDGAKLDLIDQGVSTTDSPAFVNVSVTGTVDGRDVAVDGAKLDGIEALADVTDVTNVTAAGALMDSELTSIASVKALDQGLATTDSPTFNVVTATSYAGDGSALTGLDEFTYTGSAPLFACRAWGKVGSNALVDGGNFASWDSATDTVTFTTAMPHANYAVTTNGPSAGNTWASNMTTTGFKISQRSSGGNTVNPENVEFMVVC
jgi:hypothetical protein|tara:strand:+ start:628 stop:1365 length:738 start_codon:yes stop_codon:yes gene_type:complete